MDKMRKLTACLAALLCCAPLWAQEPTDDVDEIELRRYTVEVIIFRYAEDVGAGGELFLPDEPELPPDEDALEFTDEMPPPEPAPRPEEEPEPLPDPEFVLLGEDDFKLTDAYGRLEELDAYEPLMHFGWTQLALEQDLDGTLTLYLGRYLHLVVDLQLRKPELELPAEASPGFNAFDAAPALPTPPTYYRLRESRIVKNGELRYFDHPRFGVLARVTRVEEEESPESGELLGYPLQ
jgi:hypothetical protein